MPLITTGKPGVPDKIRQAIGFWMEVDGTRPPGFMRTFVTCRCLEAIDTSQPPDWDAVIEIFTKHRARIEAVASNKFDKEGIEDGKHEGQPILTVD